jgi:hypothetical protein
MVIVRAAPCETTAARRGPNRRHDTKADGCRPVSSAAAIRHHHDSTKKEHEAKNAYNAITWHLLQYENKKGTKKSGTPACPASLTTKG